MGTWCRTDADLPEHPKTVHLQSLLGTDLKGVVGALNLLWLYCVKYAADGVLTAHKICGISRRMDLHPMSDDDVLNALRSSGFVDREDDGTMRVHGFMDRNGRHLQEAERKRAARAATGPRDKSGRYKDSPRTVRGKSPTTGRNGTVRDVTNEKTLRPVGREAPASPPAGTASASPGGPGDGSPRAVAPQTVSAIRAAFPLHDVDLILAKLIDRDSREPYRDLDAAAWRWAEAARRDGTELRTVDGASYDRSLVLERASQLDAAAGDSTTEHAANPADG